ncbi:hypothetical protein ABGA94_00675, partial [Stenotrophomonas sp. 3diitr2024]
MSRCSHCGISNATLKNALIGDGACIAPQCFIADSRVDARAYLGALVRTSNHRLDGATVAVHI